jgi:hypothetical protein
MSSKKEREEHMSQKIAFCIFCYQKMCGDEKNLIILRMRHVRSFSSLFLYVENLLFAAKLISG